MQHPCMTCGACCTQYRVAFHWMESDEVTPGGVPHQLTEVLDPHRLCMRGTHSKPVRCVALDAQIGVYSRCTIHPNRPSVCREVMRRGSTAGPARNATRRASPMAWIR